MAEVLRGEPRSVQLAVKWSPSQYLAWGPSADLRPPLLDGSRPLAESLGYRGQATDPIGTVHFGLREYDPSVGRWLSADPLGHDGSLSLYDYCDNDPVNRFDPDGRFGKQATGAVANFIGTGWNSTLNYMYSGRAEAQAHMSIQRGLIGANYDSYVSQTRYQSKLGTQGLYAKLNHAVDYGVSINVNSAARNLDAAMRFNSDYINTDFAINRWKVDAVAAAASTLPVTRIVGAARAGFAANSGSRLVHMSENAGQIVSSGKLGLPSNIYAGPASNANLSGWSLTARTGLNPSSSYKPVWIPQAGEAAFSKVTPIGPMTGQQYTARGILDINSGTFTRTGINWNQTGIYSFDAAVTGSVAGGGYYLYNQSNQ